MQSSEAQCSHKTEEHLFLIFKPWFARTPSKDKQSCFHKGLGTAGIIFIPNFNAIILTFPESSRKYFPTHQSENVRDVLA